MRTDSLKTVPCKLSTATSVRAAADVDNHIAGGFGYGQSGTDRGGYGFVNQMHFPRTCLNGRFHYGPAFHPRDTTGDADHNARLNQRGTVVDSVDEMLEHHLGDIEVSNHPVPQRPDRGNIAGGAPQHFLGGFSHLQGSFVLLVDRHH